VTDAGLRSLERLRLAIDRIGGAPEDLNQERQRPLGRLRICAIGGARVPSARLRPPRRRTCSRSSR
jgi:DNA-binding transcriptional LysR family regulator